VGDEFGDSISAELERADVMLLLVSPEFLASKYCYEIEMTRAMESHDAGEARVIPVVLRHCDWHAALFGKLRLTRNVLWHLIRLAPVRAICD
jgi:TIR domain